MKKTLFTAAIAVTLLATSCSDKDSELTETFGLPLLNLVTGDGPAKIVGSNYAFTVNYTDQKLDCSTQLPLGDSKLVLDLDDASYKFANYGFQTSVSSIPVEGSATDITNFTCNLSNLQVEAPEVPGSIQFAKSTQGIIGYNYGDVKVRTFPIDAVYSGYTTTTINGGSSFTTDKPLYRLKIDPSKLTATLLIYYGKFSDNPRMPELNLRLEGLKVTANETGYVIAGENIVPVTMGEGTPYPDFTFAEVSYETLGADLTTGKLTFRIPSKMGEFAASFQGSYLIDTSKLN